MKKRRAPREDNISPEERKRKLNFKRRKNKMQEPKISYKYGTSNINLDDFDYED